MINKKINYSEGNEYVDLTGVPADKLNDGINRDN